ncbi:MAG: dolichol-phosphate mannosyltransferase [Pseudomonadota bacterium]|jgi:dolichol-phosphate mannosyltransferase
MDAMQSRLRQQQGAVQLSVVVPCYNEEAALGALIARLTPICENCFPGSYEIVLINDGSRDRTWSLICQFAERSAHVVGVDLARNHGHQLALTAGLQICRGDLVLVIDADLQDPPELLPAMLAKLNSGFDVVYGQRTHRHGETIFKRSTAAIFYRVLGKLIDVPVPADTGDFRLMTRRVVDHLNAMPERYRFIRGMVSWVGFCQAPIAYERDARYAGHSHYPIRKMVGLALDAVTSFSILPLRLASHLGLAFGAIGLGMLGWVLVAWLDNVTIAGWASLIAVVLILGSVQLLILGMFGEYLGRMYMETKRRPLFVVREIRGQPAFGMPASVPPRSLVQSCDD